MNKKEYITNITMKKHFYLFAFALVALFFATACSSDDDEKLDPAMDSSQFVLISEHIPDVILEIRYYIICIDIMAKHSSVFTPKSANKPSFQTTSSYLF